MRNLDHAGPDHLNSIEDENVHGNLQRGKAAGPAAQRYAQEAEMSPNAKRVPKLKLNAGRGGAGAQKSVTGVRLKVNKTNLQDSNRSGNRQSLNS